MSTIECSRRSNFESNERGLGLVKGGSKRMQRLRLGRASGLWFRLVARRLGAGRPGPRRGRRTPEFSRHPVLAPTPRHFQRPNLTITARRGGQVGAGVAAASAATPVTKGGSAATKCSPFGRRELVSSDWQDIVRGLWCWSGPVRPGLAGRSVSEAGVAEWR